MSTIWIIIARRNHKKKGKNVYPGFRLGLLTSMVVILIFPRSFGSLEFLPGQRFKLTTKIYIPEGEFWMGCDPNKNGGVECHEDELPLHRVYLDAFYIDKTEVTNSQYKRCCECERPYTTPGGQGFNDPKQVRFPIAYIDWYQAKSYCEWAGGRLPTEAEWEKAARGDGDTRKYPWGDTDPTCDIVNESHLCQDEQRVDWFSEAGSYPKDASPFGVMDLAGNLHEWVNDWYQDDYYKDPSASKNPLGPESGKLKVYRGGSWFIKDNRFSMRVSERNSADEHISNEYIGFRCVYSP